MSYIFIDGSSWLYRAFHALPRLSAPDGTPSGAIVGMGNMLRKLIKEYEPQHIAVVFDPKGKTFRHEMYSEYKAQRPPVPPELSAQFEPICRLIDILGLPRITVPGVEADDVIATLAKLSSEQGHDTLVVSGDKDLAQIVNERVHILDTMKDLKLDPKAVTEKYGVRPDQIVDWLALMGDASDNVPGVPGVGAKTAAKWLGQYQTLDELVANADQIKGKIGEKLRAHLDQLSLSKSLVVIKQDVALPQALESLTASLVDTDALRSFSQDFGIKRWLEELQKTGSDEVAEPAAAELAVKLVLTETDLQALKSTLEAAPYFAVDTETDSLDAHQARLVGMSFATEAGLGWYLPLAHDYLGAPVQLTLDQVRAELGPLLADKHKAKIAQHGKYDMHVLQRHDLPLHGVQYDTMLESYVLNATGTRHDMDSLAAYYLGRQTISFSDVAGKGKKQLTFNQIDLDAASQYAAEDAEITLCLHEHLQEKLGAEPSLQAVYDSIEQPLIKVLQKIEANGVLLDRNMLAKTSEEFAQRMDAMEQQAYELAGQKFNLNSPAQLKDILFEKLELPVIRKTPKGQASTAEDVLQELAQQHDLPRLILDWRSLSKLRSTYTEKLPQAINPHSGRVHTSYHQAVAATGRLSSADPNLQNIPIRNEDGRRIRQAFIPSPSHRLIAIDYSQIELRLMAHFSADESLCEAFLNEEDIHQRTAAEVLDIPKEEVSSEQRRAAKAINFGLIYGISAFGLSKQLNISRGEAQGYMDRFFDRYPQVLAFMEGSKEQAREKGYVETLYGRRLYLNEINDRNQQRRQAAERVAINAPLQGTAADIIKRAMIAVDAEMNSQYPDAKLIMQVHDELVFEVPEDDAQAFGDRMSEIMCGVAELKVPLVAEAGYGQNWDEAHS